MKTELQVALLWFTVLNMLVLALTAWLFYDLSKARKKGYDEGFKAGKAFGIGTEVARLSKEGRIFEGPLIIGDNNFKIVIDDAVFVRKEADHAIKIDGSHNRIEGLTAYFVEDPT